ncbi:MAG: DUF2125 domain-containing protein [Alphaproteobacteria bacterium]|nr:DUF2125 domain-containing protein [Alphaproteobacteria bacterium]
MPKRFAIPLLAILIVLGLYSAYWVYARSEIVRYVEAWEAAQIEAGFSIDRNDLRVGGYPYRFSVSAENVVMRAPEIDGGWVLELNAFEANAMPYDFSHWIISLGDTVRFQQGGQGLALTTENARFSVSGADGVTQRIGSQITNLQIESLGSAPVSVTDVEALRLSAATGESGDMAIRLQLDGVQLAAEQIDPVLAGSFGDHITQLQADFVISQWPELARSSDLGTWARAGGVYSLREFHIGWGRLNMDAEGEMGLDEALRPTGRISLNILDPEAVVDAMIESGAISEENSGALRLVAQSAPRSDAGTAIPLSFRNGGVYFGPVRLGETGSIAR